MKIMTYLKLVRVEQWYKNLVVFLALFFSGNLFSVSLMYTSFVAFIALCLVSSAGYIMNDIVDRKNDALHPLKKNRPLASGMIGVVEGVILAILLLIAGGGVGLKIGADFFLILSALFILTLMYTFLLKKIMFADVLTIATLFVLRAISGAIAINVRISPWLVLCPFFLALFLAVAKRQADLLLLGKKAGQTRAVLEHYTLEITRVLLIISTTLLALSYALYSFLSEHGNLIYTLPLALLVIFRVYYFTTLEERFSGQWLKDKTLLIGIVLWVVGTAGIIYL